MEFSLSDIEKNILPEQDDEIIKARDELISLKWKLSGLVKNNKPFSEQRFLVRNKTIILNMNNKEIEDLIRLSAEKSPGLAACLAMHMFLSENVIMPYLKPETKDYLLQLDAMYRAGMKGMKKTVVPEYKRMAGFLRDIEDKNLGLVF